MYEGLERWTDQEDAFWERFDLDERRVAELFQAQLDSRGDSRFGENVVLPFTIYLYLLPAALQTLCRTWFGDEDGAIYHRLLGGLQTKTAEENIARLAAVPHDQGLAGAERPGGDDGRRGAPRTRSTTTTDGVGFLGQLDGFIARFGHRGGAERDAYHPRWRDDPTLVLRSVRLMLPLDDDQAPPPTRPGCGT